MDTSLSVVLPICCGIDVHKNTLTACRLTTGASGKVVQEVRTFRTVTAQLQELARWLIAVGCRTVALESTGVYWKPVFNALVPAGLEVVLVNAQHVKNVPGRKTDVEDAEWLATLLRVGLLRKSFVPPKEIRELRDLTRYRTQVIGLDMSRFSTASNLASWAGMCPGNRQSAGKSQGGKTRKGNGWLRQALVEAAWAASRSKGTSLSATSHRLAGRRGGKRACLAVGHRILRMVHTLLSSHRPYE